MGGADALLRLYPRAWQQRYGPEMRQLLAHDRFTLRTAIDLIAARSTHEFTRSRCRRSPAHNQE